MKVVVYETKKKPYVADIENSLDAYYEIVGDELSFHQIALDRRARFQIIANDLAIKNELPKNRRLERSEDDFDVIRGTFIITQYDHITGDSIDMEQRYIDYMLENDFVWAKESDPDPKFIVHEI
jgi:hypothetical protein